MTSIKRVKISRYNDTIAAIATAYGVGSISIVRVSGDAAYGIALKMTKKGSITPRYATLSFLYDKNGAAIDEAIVLYFKSPHSFTGEDIVEFQCHGGTAVANLILDTVISYGARLASPGEFSKRAFLNDKIDLTKAEAIAKIIETKSADAVKILSKQLKGDLKEFVESLRDELVEILSHVEVNIDYAEEDLPKDIEKKIEDRLKDIGKKITKTLQISQKKEGLINGFSISIIGKPNVGKSSLLNKLLNYNRAIISDVAGTTRDTIEEEIKIGTHLAKIIDTAGVRETSDGIEKIGVERAVESIERCDIVLAVFDGSNHFDKDDEKILDILKRYKKDKKIFVFINKSDLQSRFDIKKVESFNPIKISAKEEVDSVINAIKEYLDTQSLDDDILLTSKRQMQEIQKAYEAIQKSYEPLKDGELELFAYEINDAISHISSITRDFERDEILDKMFGSFCLGK
ncbi:MAG: tRNA uridine-5-carboxymethylaminomethyl(34) synthesis GTPase MnmE [Epsilonproteobacteria bacterium]|nr:tRNA uridine-5-carboxymethylaminomethyl(34) synthesis GTPase MnmE [Campylobacterota bacterium]